MVLVMANLLIFGGEWSDESDDLSLFRTAFI